MAASNSSPFEINDFSGGMTDQVFEQNPTKAALLDNFLLNSDKKPYSRFGSELDDVANAEVPNVARVGGLVNYANNDKLFYQSLNSIFYRNPSAFAQLLGPTGNPAYSLGTVNSVPSFSQWNRHLYTTNDAYAKPMKIFKDDSGNYQMRTGGLPALASSPTATPTSAGDQSFGYAFHFSVDYMVFNLSYQTIGPVTEIQVLNSDAPDSNPINISGIPVIANGGSDNYDVANIKIQIYRTSNGGVFFRKVGEVNNGTTTFIDNMSDTTLADTGIPLYINDGTVDFDPPPLHKYGHVVNNTGYFAAIKDASGESPYKIKQSIPGVPDTGPIDFEVSVDDEIHGMNSVRNIPIALCKKYIFRIEQSFDQFGRGNMVPVRISDTAGCISHNSCVQAENGLFWLGNEGVWYTDGYVSQKISDDNNDFYKSMIKNTALTSRCIGKFYEKERLIIWTIQRDSANKDCDSFLVLDLKFGISQRSTFVTWSFKTGIPSAIEIFNNEIYRGDLKSFVFRHDSNLTTDIKINVYKPPPEWLPETIIWTYKSIHYNFGNTFYRKYPTRILFTGADFGNTSVQIIANNDDGKSTRYCKQIRVRSDFVWRDDDFIWRETDLIWRGSGLIEQWRRFPAKSLRLSYLQIVITNGFSDITNSDALEPAIFYNGSGQVVLPSPDKEWPLYAQDYLIYTELDNYTYGWVISARISDQELTVLDPLGTFPAGSLKWVIRGFKKGEALYMLGYNIHWTNVSASQQQYSSAANATGENA